MKETELIKLFTVIGNTYSNFSFDRLKIALWLELLKDVTFDRAEFNLRQYVLNPENKFPPHPGILAERPGRRNEGNYIPGPEETRAMLAEQDRLLLQSGNDAIPESFREAVKQLAKPSVP